MAAVHDSVPVRSSAMRVDEHLFWIGYLSSFYHDRDAQELLLGQDWDAVAALLGQSTALEEPRRAAEQLLAVGLA